MATRMYRQAAPTLQDLLSGAASTPAYGEPPAPPAPDSGGGGGLSSQERQKLIELLMQPEDVGPPPPEPAGEGQRALSMAFSGLGDALSGFVAGKTSNPGFQTDYAGNMSNRFLAQRLEKQRYLRQKGEAASKAKRDTAALILSDAEKRQMREDERKGREELKQMGIDQQKAALKQARDLADEAATRETAREATKNTFLENQSKIERAKDIAVAKIHAGAENGDAAAKYDQKKLPDVLGDLSALADGAAISLGGGDPAQQIPKMTPDQLLKRADRIVESSGLSADGKAAARAFIHKELVPEIQDFNAAHGPMQGAEEKPLRVDPGDQAIMDALSKIGPAAKWLLNPNPQK